MRNLIKEIKEWEYGYLQYFRYSYKLTLWLYLNRWRRLIAFLKKHFDLIRQVSFIFVAFIVGMLVNHFGEAGINQDIISNYLVAVGVMTGGTIAIVFTISMFLLQNASDLYSSQYFEVYIHDWKEKSVFYFVILITIILLGGGLYVGSLESVSERVSSNIIFYSLIAIGIVFALIDLQYKNVRQKLNPSNAIIFLENEGTRFLKRVQYDARQIAGIIQARDNTATEGIALAVAYNRVLQPFIDNLDRQLENLVEIAMKLSDKQEVQTTKRAFTAIHNILTRFFEVRKTSSLVISSSVSILAVESDSQKFLTNTFERLNKAGEKFIRESRDENAAYIIDVYNSLAKKSQTISFIGSGGGNPILELIIYYLNFLINNGQRAKNTEVVYQGSRVLGNIAVIAANNGYEAILHGLQDDILKVAIFGLTEKQTVIVDQCINDLLKIIGVVFASTSIERRLSFRSALQHIATIANNSSALIKSGYLPNNFSTKMSLSKGYDDLYTLIWGIMQRYSKLTDIKEKSGYRSDIVELFEEINSSLRQLSENVKDCDSVLTDSVGRLLSNVNELIIGLIRDKEFVDVKDELITCLKIHLPYWFVRHAIKFDGGSMHFYALTDSVTRTGILAAEKLGNKELVKDCISCLYSITEQCLEKTTSSYGYDEPRVLEKACYLGILALKKGWNDVFIEVGLKIYDFEPKYFAKYFTNLPAGIDPENHNVIGLPHKNQLFVELLKWRDDFDHVRLNGNLRIRDDAESMMYSLVEPLDIDRFMFEVWGKFSANSEIEDEIKLKFARGRLVHILKQVKNNKGKL